MHVVVDGLIYGLQRTGGISRVFNELLPRMCELEPHLRITLVTDGELRQPVPRHAQITQERVPAVERYLRPGRLWRPLLPQARALAMRWRAGSGDGAIWHSTYYSLPARWRGAIVTTVHDMIHERFPGLFASRDDDRLRARKRQSVLEADAVVCVSETTRREVVHAYHLTPERTWVVPHAVSAAFRPASGETGEPSGETAKPFVLYVGRRAGYKNFSGLLHAYRGWSRRHEVNLVLVGPPWSAAERRDVVHWGLAGSIHLVTEAGDGQLCLLYNQARALVYPSLDEGFGLPVLEAMACGCPVVASPIPSTVEIAGDVPFYFELGGPDAMQAALDAALDHGRRPERELAGLQRAEGYSWDRSAAQLLRIYQDVNRQ